MQQLDPKAVWLFFFSFIMRWVIVFAGLGFYFSLALSPLADVTDSELSLSTIFLNLFGWIFGLIILLLLISWFWAKLSYRYYRYELKEEGFRKESGVIYKKYVTIPYDRIQNVDINRGILARLLGLSDLNIQTAGAGVATPRFGGAGAEGRLPGLSMQAAEQVRDELINRARRSKNQGL